MSVEIPFERRAEARMSVRDRHGRKEGGEGRKEEGETPKMTDREVE